MLSELFQFLQSFCKALSNYSKYDSNYGYNCYLLLFLFCFLIIWQDPDIFPAFHWLSSLLLSWVFTSAKTDGFSLKSEWQQVSSHLKNSIKYSSWSYKCYGLENLNSSSDLQYPQVSFPSLRDYSKSTVYNWYYYYSRVPQLFQLSDKIQVSIIIIIIFTIIIIIDSHYNYFCDCHWKATFPALSWS